ncbi:MAG: hypothetical protein QGM50_06065 [Anaerolineae bacterium]|nr:hypothetical protein [Anaerolineae bacterium]MDK1080271.1 hypothetical protein [Anaerolineae bacterium]MDK1118343.1 hypothetical protein [Anaerolineae bacterium]
MRRGRIFIFLALLLVVGLVVVVIIFNTVINTTSQAEESVQIDVNIFIAGQPIPQGAVITNENLGIITIRQENLTGVMFAENQRAQLEGKIAKYPLDQGVVITSSMVSTGTLAEGGPPWAAQIPNGMTAIAIPTSRLASMAYGIQDGAHVDISVCFFFIDIDPSYQTELPNLITPLTAPTNVLPAEQPGLTLGVGLDGSKQAQGRTEVESAFQQGIYVIPSESQRPRPACQILVQNAVVLKMGSYLDQPTTVEGEPAAPPIPDIVSLIVSPQDAITLSYLNFTNVNITMTLRSASDNSRVATEAATLQFLLSQYNIPVPAKLPYAIKP